MSTATGELRSINCTACGAGLSVLGGGRVRALACDYCGSLLDATDSYRVLERYRSHPDIRTELEIGQTGTLWGVAWTVIGVMQMSETWEGERWDWVDHALYSPTHGYCYLTHEDGHWTFTRKVRGIGNSGWFTHTRVNTSENQPVTWWQGRRFQYYESGTRKIEAVIGSFNFAPRRGDRTQYVSFLGKTEMLTQATGVSGEREVELTQYVPPEDLATGFGLAPFTPRGVHPTQPFMPWAHARFARLAGFAGAGVALLLWLFLLGHGETILFKPNMPTSAPIQTGFEITDTDDLTVIRLSSNANNAWAWYDIELVGPNGDTVAEFGRQSEYYQGVEDGERWSEGSRTAKASLRLSEPGPYQLIIEQSEQGTWGFGSRTPNQISLTIEQGVKSPGWMLLAALASALFGGLFLGKRLWHHQRRWAGSDWTDED